MIPTNTPMELGEERDVVDQQGNTVRVRAVMFRDHETAVCGHCPGAALTGGCRLQRACGEELRQRLVPVDMVPILFLEGVLE